MFGKAGEASSRTEESGGPFNERKGSRPVETFFARNPDLLSKILARDKAPLRDAAAVNATRWALYQALKRTGLPVEQGTGGRTKYNRTRLGLPKTHSLDAACAGDNVDIPLLQGISRKHCRLLQRADGYGYSQIAQKGDAGTALSLLGINAEASRARG